MGFQIDNGVLVKYQEEPGITEVVIPEGVTGIGNQAFMGCKSLTSIVIPKGVTRIGQEAFRGCSSLTSIDIPKSVTSIGPGAFSGCSSLTSISIPEGVTSIEGGEMYGFGRGTFSGCTSLTSIIIPKSVISIGDFAFSECFRLASIVIPKGVTRIGQEAFGGCSSLTTIVIPEGVTSIGPGAFSKCSSLTSISIPEGVTSIEGGEMYGFGRGTFSGCTSLTSIIIPKSVISIGDFAFSECFRLASIDIPKNVTSIGQGSFSNCLGLTTIVIPEGVTSIGNNAFSRCSSLTSIIIPKSATRIGQGTFGGCSSLTTIVIPEGVTSIGNNAFSGCSSLTSIIIPDSVTSIGQCAFEGCNELEEIHDILSLIIKGCKIHVTTITWLLENIWNGPDFLSETSQVYLTNPGKAGNEICESRLFENCDTTADVMLKLIETNRNNGSALKIIATFVLKSGGMLPREKLIAIYEALQKIGAKPALKLLERAVQSDSALPLEGGTGHPIEAICLKRYNEVEVDKKLIDYGISPKLFEGVRYKGSKTLAPPFVIKCAIFPYMQKIKGLPRHIGGYLTDFVEIKPDSQIDQIAAALEREDLQALLGDLILKFEPFKWRLLLPYCRYGSGKQMKALAQWVKKWAVWEDYNAAGRQFIIILHGAMMLNESREAMFLVEKWGLLDEYAKFRNTTPDVLRDTVLTEFYLDSDGSKRYDLGNAVIAASITQDLSVTLFNETDGKYVNSLPKKGADPEKYAAASEDFADLKKNIKNAVKSRVEKLKEDFVSGKELPASDWKASYLNNYVLKRVASLLVWQWKNEEATMRFMLTMDGAITGCDGQPVQVTDAGSIFVAHPVEVPLEELNCWKDLLTKKKLAQPFVQMFEPICDIDPSAAAESYKGIELPMFLLRGLAKEGVQNTFFMYEGGSLEFQGKAISIDASFSGAFFNERSIPFDEIVKLNDVKIMGTPRAVNHEIYAMDKALIENRVRNGDIANVHAFSHSITAKTIQHLIDVAIDAEKTEVTAWLMNYKNDHFPYTFPDLEL